MKLIASFSIVVALISSCSPVKTVYISNKTGSPITLVIDTTYHTSYTFKDSLNGLRIENKKVINYGKGKWTKEDKASIEKLIKHIKVVKDGSSTAIDMPEKTKVSHISILVEELWLNIK